MTFEKEKIQNSLNQAIEHIEYKKSEINELKEVKEQTSEQMLAL